MPTRRMTCEEYIARAREVHGDRYDYSQVDYQGSRVYITIVCPKHGPFEQRPDQHLQGRGCPACSPRAKQTTERFVERAREIHGDLYDYSEVDYRGMDEPVTIICPEHGPFKQRPANHLQGRRCPVCGIRNIALSQRMSTSEFIAKARAVHGNRYDYSQVDYQGMPRKVTIICPEHGPFEQAASSHLHGKAGCPRCKVVKLRERNVDTVDGFIAKARMVHGDRYDYSQVDYYNAREKVVIICPDHGAFEQTPDGHLAGKGCSRCFAGRQASAQELELADFIRGIYDGPVVDHDTSVLGSQQLDAYLPELGLAFEFNGCFWHSEHHKPSDYHARKLRRCADAGVQLVFVWLDDWVLRRHAVEQMVAYKMGRLSEAWDEPMPLHMGARECSCTVCDGKAARAFLEVHHVQGAVSATFHLALVDKAGNMRAVLSLRSARNSARMRRAEGVWEIQRFATCGIVPGGFSKLLSHAREHILEQGLPLSKWVSFSSNDVSDGGLYESCGFTAEAALRPDYKYAGPITGHIRRSKERFQKRRFRDDPALRYEEGLTEHELAALNGLYRVYDSGKVRWTKDA